MRRTNTMLGGCVAAIALSATLATADPVVLESLDGSINVTGTLLSSDAETYVIETAVGQMRIAASTVTCTGEGCPVAVEVPEFDIAIHGSDTVGEELMPLLIEGFSSRLEAAVAERREIGADRVALSVKDAYGNGDKLLDVEILSEGSSVGLRHLIERKADIAMSSRPARSEEILTIAQDGRGNLTDIDHEYIVAVDSIIPVVSPQNDMGSLGMDELAAIFSGRVDNWAQVGGADLPITVYSRNADSGTFGVFSGQVLAPTGQELSPEAVILPSNQAIADAVTEDPGGIGYVGFAYVRGAKPIDLVASCGIKLNAGVFASKTEEYPLERRLRLYVDNSELSDHVEDLLAYAISREAEPLIQKAGFIDLGVVEDDTGLESSRLLEAAEQAGDAFELGVLRQMLIDLTGAKRLSTTFRFAPASRLLDNKAQRDLGRMIDFLERPENSGREVMFVGFTDSDGPFSANVALSVGRAETALANLLNHPEAGRLTGLRARAIGYGELSPVACNEDFKGRQRNRRVEVWVR
ncbi:MAG: phosphate ABC transporter substrate-binding/OmpA family protein [Pseudomonadota bacterium]